MKYADTLAALRLMDHEISMADTEHERLDKHRVEHLKELEDQNWKDSLVIIYPVDEADEPDTEEEPDTPEGAVPRTGVIVCRCEHEIVADGRLFLFYGDDDLFHTCPDGSFPRGWKVPIRAGLILCIFSP